MMYLTSFSSLDIKHFIFNTKYLYYSSIKYAQHEFVIIILFHVIA